MTCNNCVKKAEGKLHARVLELGGTISRRPDKGNDWWVHVSQDRPHGVDVNFNGTGTADVLLAALQEHFP